MEWTSLGWRDGVLLLVVLVALYLVFMLVKLTRVGRRPTAGTIRKNQPVDMVQLRDTEMEREEPHARTDIPADAYQAELPHGEPFAVPPQPTFEWEEVRSLFGDTVERPADPTLPITARRSGGFGEHLAEHLARSDVESEVQRMRSEMERMRSEMEELRAARRVSPQYAEAMEMAQRGLSAQDLADRLGISLGEAELVHALSRSDQNFEEGEDHGTEPYAVGYREFGHR